MATVVEEERGPARETGQQHVTLMSFLRHLTSSLDVLEQESSLLALH